MNQVNCQVCSSDQGRTIYTALNVPTHSVRLIHSAKNSLAVEVGNIRLHACQSCGFVWNRDFKAELMRYDQNYEETQGFSNTFNDYQREMTCELVERYELKGKSVLEIGCGKGEFLSLLIELGIGQGLGFDPSFKAERLEHDSRLSFVTDFFPPKDDSATPSADVYWCKMTLEHIDQPAQFIQQLRNSICNENALVIFQIPALERILDEVAYWDIYYEHCNYFSRDALHTLFAIHGFEVLEITTQFEQQYHTIVAKPSSKSTDYQASVSIELSAKVNRFEKQIKTTLSSWQAKLTQAASANSEDNNGLLIWGAASKAVGLLNALPSLREGVRLVDINPYKQHTFLPSTGLQIEAPQDIAHQHFELILVANPIYQDEIRAELKSLGVSGKLVCLE